MDSTNYTSPDSDILHSSPDPQAIGTQIDFDGSWDLFWHEFSMLNPTTLCYPGSGWNGSQLSDVGMTVQTVEPQAIGTWPEQLPLPSQGQIDLYLGCTTIDQSLSVPTAFTDTYPTPPWSNPSTTNPSPSATTSRSTASSPNSMIPQNVSSAPENPYICNICAQSFPKRCFLNRHTNTHTKPYRCSFPNCNERRATRRDLQRHVNAHDATSAPVHLCSELGCEYSVKGFNRRDNLKRHLRMVHGIRLA